MTRNIKTIGSRAEVMHGNAVRTSGGLTKKDLKYNSQGKIVSRAASNAAKRNKNLGNNLGKIENIYGGKRSTCQYRK